MTFVVESDAAQVAAALLAAGDRLLDLAPVNTQAGAVVEEAAVVPHRTGALAASVHTVAGPQVVVVGSNLRYATFVHWGAPRHNVKAQPFLLTALDVSTTEITDLYTEHARQIVADI